MSLCILLIMGGFINKIVHKKRKCMTTMIERFRIFLYSKVNVTIQI